MAVAAQISDAFMIRVALDGDDTFDVTNPGRTFRIVGVRAFNANNTGALRVQRGGADVRADAATTNAVWQDSILVEANCDVTAAQNIELRTSAAGWAVGSAVHIYCVATGGGQALTAT